MRIGIGYDIHRLEDGRRLVLGGIEIPYIKGLLGHSDGDVVLHAIADAILGAIGSADIGQHFPNTDPAFMGISSSLILKKVKAMAEAAKMRIANVDCVVIAEEPKIFPFRDKRIEAISGILKINYKDVNIKATTNEGVGALGRGEAIAAYAVVLLE